ncbi:MAG TPA: hypothetical protein VFC67_08930 [Prolixibacteraceae bacterium]|nr:hypothetical protein [Prolixibacteraceae bacterium]
MERCTISVETFAGKSFCPRLPVPNRRVSQDAVVDKVSLMGKNKDQTFKNIWKCVNYINIF